MSNENTNTRRHHAPEDKVKILLEPQPTLSAPETNQLWNHTLKATAPLTSPTATGLIAPPASAASVSCGTTSTAKENQGARGFAPQSWGRRADRR